MAEKLVMRPTGAVPGANRLAFVLTAESSPATYARVARRRDVEARQAPYEAIKWTTVRPEEDVDVVVSLLVHRRAAEMEASEKAAAAGKDANSARDGVLDAARKECRSRGALAGRLAQDLGFHARVLRQTETRRGEEAATLKHIKEEVEKNGGRASKSQRRALKKAKQWDAELSKGRIELRSLLSEWRRAADELLSQPPPGPMVDAILAGGGMLSIGTLEECKDRLGWDRDRLGSLQANVDLALESSSPEDAMPLIHELEEERLRVAEAERFVELLTLLEGLKEASQEDHGSFIVLEQLILVRDLTLVKALCDMVSAEDEARLVLLLSSVFRLRYPPEGVRRIGETLLKKETRRATPSSPCRRALYTALANASRGVHPSRRRAVLQEIIGMAWPYKNQLIARFGITKDMLRKAMDEHRRRKGQVKKKEKEEDAASDARLCLEKAQQQLLEDDLGLRLVAQSTPGGGRPLPQLPEEMRQIEKELEAAPRRKSKLSVQVNTPITTAKMRASLALTEDDGQRAIYAAMPMDALQTQLLLLDRGHDRELQAIREKFDARRKPLRVALETLRSREDATATLKKSTLVPSTMNTAEAVHAQVYSSSGSSSGSSTDSVNGSATLRLDRS